MIMNIDYGFHQEQQEQRNLQADFEKERHNNTEQEDDDDADDDDDWVTITSEDEAEDDRPVKQVVVVDCHEITGKAIFDMPTDTTIEPCPICFENIDQMINVVVNRCGHAFHASCMFEALEHAPGCPMCRCQLVQMVDYDDDSDFEADDEAEDDEEEVPVVAEPVAVEAEPVEEAEPVAVEAEPVEEAAVEPVEAAVVNADISVHDDLKSWLKFHKDFELHYTEDMFNHYVNILVHYQTRNQRAGGLGQPAIYIPKTGENIKQYIEEAIKEKVFDALS